MLVSKIKKLKRVSRPLRKSNIKMNSGLNFYNEKTLTSVIENAALNFYDAHQRLPRVDGELASYDYVFLAKFMCSYPTEPNIASKQYTEKFLTPRLRQKLFFPFRVTINHPLELSRLDQLGEKSYLIKPALGNGGIVTVNGQKITKMGGQVHRLLKTGAQPYGFKWGEWLYAASPNRAIIEEDISSIIISDEYQFYVNAGEVKMFRLARNNNVKQQSENVISYCYFDEKGNLIPGTLVGKQAHFATPTSEFLDDMYEISECVAKHVDFARVDFILTVYGPYLNEITCFQGNARFECTNSALENAHRNSMRFKFIECHDA